MSAWQCSPETAAGASIDLGADIGTLAQGTPVTIQFFGSGINRLVDGEAIGAGQEYGIYGVRFVLDHGDPLWDAIRSEGELFYTVLGFTAQALPLRGANAPASRFLAACRTLAAGAGCDQLGALRSTEGGAAVTVRRPR